MMRVKEPYVAFLWWFLLNGLPGLSLFSNPYLLYVSNISLHETTTWSDSILIPFHITFGLGDLSSLCTHTQALWCLSLSLISISSSYLPNLPAFCSHLHSFRVTSCLKSEWDRESKNFTHHLRLKASSNKRLLNIQCVHVQISAVFFIPSRPKSFFLVGLCTSPSKHNHHHQQHQLLCNHHDGTNEPCCYCVYVSNNHRSYCITVSGFQRDWLRQRGPCGWDIHPRLLRHALLFH